MVEIWDLGWDSKAEGKVKNTTSDNDTESETHEPVWFGKAADKIVDCLRYWYAKRPSKVQKVLGDVDLFGDHFQACFEVGLDLNRLKKITDKVVFD